MDALGLLTFEDGGKLTLEEPLFGTPFATTLQGYDFYADDLVTVKEVKAPAEQMPKELLFIPGLLLLGLIFMLQRARASKQGVPA